MNIQIEKNIPSTYYYPFCKEKGCNGLLKIKINEDFSLNYQCEKNKNHKKKTIYFKTFERFYLQEKKIETCSKCNLNLEIDIKYKCKQCNSIYCGACFILDEHINKDISNLIINTNKCTIHKKDLTHYCTKCNKNLCIYCIKDTEENNIHECICLVDLMPSSNKIKDLKSKIKKRAQNYENIINIIDIWKKKIISKIDELKQNLKDEIDLMEKMFSNYNKYFVNYTYFQNFEYFYDYISQKDSDKFKNCENLQNLTNVLFKIFNISNDNSEIKNKKELDIEIDYQNKLHQNDINYSKIEKINDEYLFSYSTEDKKVSLTYIDNENNSLKDDLEDTKLKFKREISSISSSIDQKKIYVCLANKRIVKIFNFDINQKMMEESNEEINDEDESDKHFNKCIEISNGLVATADNDMVSIWIKNDDITNSYSNINNLLINEVTCDLLLVNNEYFICSQPIPKTITFIQINSLSEEKSMTNIDCVPSNNCLFLFKTYILINCKKGIALINAGKKEFIQYIESNFTKITNKLLCSDNRNNFFVLVNQLENEQNYGIFHLKFIEGTFEIIRKYYNIKLESEEEDEKIKQIICMDKLILCSNKVYIFEIFDDMD